VEAPTRPATMTRIFRKIDRDERRLARRQKAGTCPASHFTRRRSTIIDLRRAPPCHDVSLFPDILFIDRDINSWHVNISCIETRDAVYLTQFAQNRFRTAGRLPSRFRNWIDCISCFLQSNLTKTPIGVVALLLQANEPREIRRETRRYRSTRRHGGFPLESESHFAGRRSMRAIQREIDAVFADEHVTRACAFRRGFNPRAPRRIDVPLFPHSASHLRFPVSMPPIS